MSKAFQYLWGSDNVFSAIGGDKKQEWKRYRDIAQKAFTDTSLNSIFLDQILPRVNKIHDTIDELGNLKNVNMSEIIGSLTFDVISASGFGHTSNKTENSEGRTRFASFLNLLPLHMLSSEWLWPLYPRLPFQFFQTSFDHLRLWKESVFGIIKGRHDEMDRIQYSKENSNAPIFVIFWFST